MADKGNKVLSANEGAVFVNNELWDDVTKASAKATADFEDVNFVGDSTTYKRYKGVKGEGSITIKKKDSRATRLIIDGIRTGDMPEIKIIAKQATLSGKAERFALYGVVFSELQLFNLEANALIEQELPFTFSSFEPLDYID